MKSKLFKKIIAGISSIAMLASLTIVPATVEAATPVYSQDFESGTAVNYTTSLGNNSTERTLTNAAGNATTFYNVYTSVASGNRAQSFTFDSAYGAGKGVRLSMLLRVMGSNQNGSEFQIRDSAGTSLFNFACSSYMGSPTINGESVSLTAAKLGSAVLGASDYAATGWLKVEATVDFRSAPALVNVTVTDTTNGNALVYESMYTTTATNIKSLYGSIGRSNGAFAYDNILIEELSDEELPKTVTYTVTYSVSDVETKEVVEENAMPQEIPATDKTAYIFKGWAKDGDTENLLSNDDVLATPVTADVTYTAVYEKDPDYIEPMVSVEFSAYPSGNMLVAGADTATFGSNPIAVKVTGELGTDLLANPDSRVTDLSVDYEVSGFEWIADKNEAATKLCDDYAELVEENYAADFKLKEHTFNYYGQLTATVTYNGATMSITKPLAYIGNSNANLETGQILPRGGYYEDFNRYSPDMVGYQAATSADNRGASDVVTDNWAAYGGNTKTLKLTEEDGSKFLRIEATGTNSSCFAGNQIEAVTDTQVVFEQLVRFHNNSTILLKTDNPVTWSNNATTFSLGFEDGKFGLNGSQIGEGTTGVWYKIVITSDVTSGKCYAVVYNEDGTEKICESEIVNFVNAGSVNPKFYLFRTPDRSKGKLDFNNVTVKRAVIDESTLKTTTTAETLAVPEAGMEAVTAELSVSAETTTGIPAIGKAEWTIADETATGVVITPSAEDSHTATLTVSEGAAAGTLPIVVSIGGKAIEMSIQLSSSQDSVRFKNVSGNAPSSISIPLKSDQVDSYTYDAEVIDGDGVAVDGREITYELYDSKNQNKVTSLEGITFENGVLNVTSAAKATVVYVRANSVNEQNEPISKSIKVDIHGLAFDFGAGTEEDVVAGYTAVTPNSTYSEKAGYGIDGVATAGGDASVENAGSDYLAGTYTFKANVDSDKIYSVKINYMGSLASEYVNSDLSGVVLSNGALSEVTYQIPVFDGVLDLALSGTDAKIASIEISPVEDKAARVDKPHIFSIGDSTIANRNQDSSTPAGTSWAYGLAGNYTTKYPELEELATFSNNGAGSRNLSSYYTEGKLRSVLNSIQPGDYVMIGCMGTNGMGSHFEDNLNYYIDSCMKLGANVILYSYTPHGAKGNWSYVYNSDTQTFTGYRTDSYDNILRATYDERKDELAGFVEIGKNADEIFNKYVDDYELNGYESRDAAAQAIIACFPDHNHYYHSNLVRDLMLDGYDGTKGIVEQIVDVLEANTGDEPIEPPAPEYGITYADGVITILTEEDYEAANVYVATYNTDGSLAGVTVKPVTLIANEAETVGMELAEGAKVMLWNGSEPIFDVFEVEAAEVPEA